MQKSETMRCYLLCLFIFLATLNGRSQSKWEMGVLIGTNAYQGDLSSNRVPSIESFSYSYGAYVRRHLSPTWAVRANYLGGKWYASDLNSENPLIQERGFSFSNQLQEGSLLVEWNPLRKRKASSEINFYASRAYPFFYLGVGGLWYRLENTFPSNPSSTLLELIEQDRRSSSNYRSLVVPAGMGLKLELNQSATLSIEGGPHYGFNDLLDGVSSSGNPQTNDWFWHGGIGLSLFIGKQDLNSNILDQAEAAQALTPNYLALKNGASPPKWELGALVGATAYQGDLMEQSVPGIESFSYAYGLFMRRYLSPNWAFRINYLGGNWMASDADAKADYLQSRNFSFQNHLSEGSLLFEWDPWGHKRFPDGPFRFRTRVSPFFYLGFGVGYYRIENSFPEELPLSISDQVRKDQEASSKYTGLSFPAGLGLKIDLSKRTTVSIEGGPHYGFNDLFDGVSQSGNPKANDWYWHGGVGLSVRLGKKDSDGDGIPDSGDACRYVAGVFSARGCPDKDGDGVEDAEDVCPELPGLIEFSGCPDTDNDGIMDPADSCPTVYGYAETNGCPDLDNDCVTDSLDRCPNIAGPIELDGCPDTDGDGLVDIDDLCPDSVGLPENKGCPLLDTDCDGNIDEFDECPEIQDTIGFTGCPDLDLDGILDSLDLCPEIPGPDSTQGCPIVTKEAEILLVKAQQAVQFQTGSAELLSSSKAILDEVVNLLKEASYYQLSLAGYTDNVGRASTNQRLSERRAKSCYDYLIEKGIDADRIDYMGYGEEDPIGNNNSREGRKMNRRVEFEITVSVKE